MLNVHSNCKITKVRLKFHNLEMLVLKPLASFCNVFKVGEESFFS